MTGIFTDLSVNSRSIGMQRVTEYAAGKRVITPFVQQFTDLKFQQLQDALKSRNSSAMSAPGNTAKQIAMVFTAALLRDSRYCTSRRRWMQGLGFNTSLRGLYEGGNINIQALNKK